MDPDQYSEYGSESSKLLNTDPIRIRIHNTGSYPAQNHGLHYNAVLNSVVKPAQSWPAPFIRPALGSGIFFYTNQFVHRLVGTIGTILKEFNYFTLLSKLYVFLFNYKNCCSLYKFEKNCLKNWFSTNIIWCGRLGWSHSRCILTSSSSGSTTLALNL